MSEFAKSLVPLLTTIALAVVSLLPWGVPPALRLCPTLVPLVAIMIWNASRAGDVPAWGAFVLGLAIDVLTYGPLGYWAGCYVLAGVLSQSLRRDEEPLEALYSWLGLMAVLAAVLLIAWGIASAYFSRLVDWRPFLLALVVMGAAMPVVAAVLSPALRWVEGPHHPTLVRRGAT